MYLLLCRPQQWRGPVAEGEPGGTLADARGPPVIEEPQFGQNAPSVWVPQFEQNAIKPPKQLGRYRFANRAAHDGPEHEIDQDHQYGKDRNEQQGFAIVAAFG